MRLWKPTWGEIARLRRMLRNMALACAFVVTSFPASAQNYGQAKTVDEITAYLGIMPAAIVKGHPRSHPERSAHGGAPSGEHEYHLIVAIFDATSGARIEDAKLSVRVSALGLSGPRRALEPMQISGTVTYGNYFNLPDKGPYTIDLEIERPTGTVRFGFTYEHWVGEGR